MNKTIVIADDNAALCSGIREFINAQDGFEVVGVAANGNEALRLIDLYKPDFVVLDIVMPELDGFGVLGAMENIFYRHNDVPTRKRWLCAKSNAIRCKLLSGKTL